MTLKGGDRVKVMTAATVAAVQAVGNVRGTPRTEGLDGRKARLMLGEMMGGAAEARLRASVPRSQAPKEESTQHVADLRWP